jgi:RHS repeat-associated protein
MPDASTLDAYLWLDGRPVALIKTKFAASWTRPPDLTGDCKRNGESVPSGVYFLVTDYLQKPVLMLDSYRRVSGMAEYAPFGHINRVTYLGDTAHPYANNTRSVLGYFNQPAPSAATRVQLRARYAFVDVEGGYDFAYLSDQNGNELWPVEGDTARVTGRQQGPQTSGWVEVPQQSGQGRVHARFFSDYSVTYKGVVLEGYEYRRFQEGASPVWTPLRFPGQYHDAETDLFENWNRYYDPVIGKYLAPDPMMHSADYAPSEARAGRSAAAYVYAMNNPLAFVDPKGLLIANVRTAESIALEKQKECNGGGTRSCISGVGHWLAGFRGGDLASGACCRTRSQAQSCRAVQPSCPHHPRGCRSNCRYAAS